MRVVACVAALCLLATAAVAQTVVDATDATFDEVIKGDFVMMEFYAPWCGHCKKLEPEYNKAAEMIGSAAVLAKLDATVEKQAAGKYGIQGFPTIKIFRNGELAGDYNGGRTAADMVKYIKANSGPAVQAVANADALAAMKKEHPALFVAFLETPGGEVFDAFEAVAKKLRSEFAFAVVTDAAVTSAEGASAGSIVVFKQFDDGKAVFAGDVTVDTLTTFAKDEGAPLFDEIGPENYKMYIDRKLPILWVFATPKDTAAMEAGKGAAPALKGKLSTVWIDSSKYGQMAERLGLSGKTFPAVAIDDEGKHFAMPEGIEYTAENIGEFAQKFLKNELERVVRSETAPEPHTVDGLTTVVGTTFADLVENADQDVFIEFYAPWCGHCKQLAPVYEKVAKAFADKPVRIAKVDATANDIPQDKFNVQGFPTMFFVPKATHVPEVYEGGRSEADLTKFLEGKL